MKKLIILFVAFAVLLQVSCSKQELDNTNTDPTKSGATTFDPNFLLSNAQLTFANTGYGQLIYEAPMMQALTATVSYYGNGDKYINVDNYLDYQSIIWNNDYTAFSSIKEMQLLANQKGADKYSNLISIGDIMNVLIMERITDTYGDVPYSQAGQAKAGIKAPAYDTQQDIYKTMLTTLETAIGKLDASKDVAAEDLFYKGNIPQWKKLGYSLMLRVAMRLTKVDIATAQLWAEKAAAGGTFANNADNAIVATDGSVNANSNSSGSALLTDFQGVKWAKTFIDQMKADHDPRLSYISELVPPGLTLLATKAPGDTSTANQLGQPNGYDLNGGTTDIRNAPGYPGAAGTGSDADPTGKYSHPRTSVYANLSAPILVMTYAETEFLLAEAAVRGWNVGSINASAHYKNALTYSLLSLAQMSATAAIPLDKITAYVNSKPLNTSSTESSLKDINTQYWVSTASTFSFMENWFNWKRSGYPVLTPINYNGNVTNATIPRRMPYLSSENITNQASYQAAVAKLSGGDVLTSRVWWDK